MEEAKKRIADVDELSRHIGTCIQLAEETGKQEAAGVLRNLKGELDAGEFDTE
jgi:hypothetical protein